MTPLDNILWNCLAGPHARYALGTGAVRRYADGFSPIVGFADPTQPDFEALAHCAAIGEAFYCDRWVGPCPRGWSILSQALMCKMVHAGPVPPCTSSYQPVALTDADVPAALALTALTKPGPFGPRTIELGAYFGCFVDGALVAMAGERLQYGAWQEISGVCTAPAHQGRGYAALLVTHLLQRQAARNQRPFLHVMSANTRGRALYARLGFTHYMETTVRVVDRNEDGNTSAHYRGCNRV